LRLDFNLSELQKERKFLNISMTMYKREIVISDSYAYCACKGICVWYETSTRGNDEGAKTKYTIAWR